MKFTDESITLAANAARAAFSDLTKSAPASPSRHELWRNVISAGLEFLCVNPDAAEDDFVDTLQLERMAEAAWNACVDWSYWNTVNDLVKARWRKSMRIALQVFTEKSKTTEERVTIEPMNSVFPNLFAVLKDGREVARMFNHTNAEIFRLGLIAKLKSEEAE